MVSSEDVTLVVQARGSRRLATGAAARSRRRTELPLAWPTCTWKQ